MSTGVEGCVFGEADCAFIAVDGSAMRDDFRSLFGGEGCVFGEGGCVTELDSTADDDVSAIRDDF